ncbi:hypothetical protein V2O64_07355 [Verrucomicrobiaceae bacterium 227]
MKTTAASLFLITVITGYAFAEEALEGNTATSPAPPTVQLFESVIPAVGIIVSMDGNTIRVQFHNRMPATNIGLGVIKQGIGYPIATLKIREKKGNLFCNCTLDPNTDISGMHGVAVGDLVVEPVIRKTKDLRDGADQSATAPESKSESKEKTKLESGVPPK